MAQLQVNCHYPLLHLILHLMRINFEIVSVRGLTTAKQIVDFFTKQPMFRQSIQAKFLNATTTRRSYYHLTGSEVEALAPKQLVRARAVKPLDGEKLSYCQTQHNNLIFKLNSNYFT